MANGYDQHSLQATGLQEASSSSMPPMVAVRDKRFTRNGIGFRTQEEAYAGGTATGKRGEVDESRRPWETAQEATSPQVRPRDSLPPWLRGKEDDDDDDKGEKGDDDKPKPFAKRQRKSK
jgi:hypothetical protein